MTDTRIADIRKTLEFIRADELKPGYRVNATTTLRTCPADIDRIGWRLDEIEKALVVEPDPLEARVNAIEDESRNLVAYLQGQIAALTERVETHTHPVEGYRPYAVTAMPAHPAEQPVQPADAGGEDADEDDDYRPELMMDIDGDEITFHISSRFRINREEFEEACAVELGLVVPPADKRLAPLDVSDEDVTAARKALHGIREYEDPIATALHHYASRENAARGYTDREAV